MYYVENTYVGIILTILLCYDEDYWKDIDSQVINQLHRNERQGDDRRIESTKFDIQTYLCSFIICALYLLSTHRLLT